MPNTKRIPEIDILRGIAILLMIIYHIIFDLEVFFHININHHNIYWYIIGKSSAILFITLSGISTAIVNKQYNNNLELKKNTQRGLIVLFWALLISLVTWIINPSHMIIFGILHFLGFSIILSHWFRKYIYLNIILAIIIWQLGNIFSQLSLSIKWLLPLGIKYPYFQSWDYYPIFPWFSLILIGIAIGNISYSYLIKNNHLQLYYNKWLSKISNNSLKIYLLHQPIIILLLWLIINE